MFFFKCSINFHYVGIEYQTSKGNLKSKQLGEFVFDFSISSSSSINMSGKIACFEL